MLIDPMFIQNVIPADLCTSDCEFQDFDVHFDDSVKNQNPCRWCNII